jgi:peptidoglycan LD-endopeptidase LytH
MPRSVFLVLLLAAACSQRSPWVAAPGPVREPGRERATAPGRPTQQASPLIALATVASSEAAILASVGSLYFPVAGRDGSPLADSFGDARDGGDRQHKAIDIMAPRGTPVLSVQDGRILRLSTSSRGGITLYATDREERFVFYYAHLDRYHPNVRANMPVMRGDTIGYVGTTGNAPANVPHLHFQLMRMPSDRRYWNGEPINPYPLLKPLSSADSSGR